jgi:hypothetical protein
MKLRIERTVVAVALMGLGLVANQAGATSSSHVHTKTCGHVVTPPPPTTPAVYVQQTDLGTTETTFTEANGEITVTEIAKEALKFIDPTLSNGSDRVSQITFAGTVGGTMTVKAGGESTSSKVVVASTKTGTLGLGIDSCNRDKYGKELKLSSGCGYDSDLDFYVNKDGVTYSESIKILFEDQITLDSVAFNGVSSGEGVGVIVGYGNPATSQRYNLTKLSNGQWGLPGTELLGSSFAFFVYGCDPSGIYLSSLSIHSTSSSTTPSAVPEPESLALVLAGALVVGGALRRRRAQA